MKGSARLTEGLLSTVPCLGGPARVSSAVVRTFVSSTLSTTAVITVSAPALVPLSLLLPQLTLERLLFPLPQLPEVLPVLIDDLERRGSSKAIANGGCVRMPWTSF